MALTQEEIRIKAGLDYSRVTAGLQSIRGQIFKLASDVPNRLGSILKANVYAAAGDMIGKLAEKATEAWIKIYGQDQAVADAKNRTMSELAAFGKSVVEQLRKTAEALNAAKDKALFDSQSTQGKLKILREQEASLRNQIALTDKLIQNQESAIAAYDPTAPNHSHDERNRAILEKGQLQARRNNLATQLVQNDSAQRNLREQDLKEYGPKFQEKFKEYQANLNQKGPEAPRRMTYAEMTQASSRTWQGHIDAVNSFGKPPQPTPQPEPGTPGAPPLRVSIVDIEDK